MGAPHENRVIVTSILSQNYMDAGCTSDKLPKVVSFPSKLMTPRRRHFCLFTIFKLIRKMNDDFASFENNEIIKYWSADDLDFPPLIAKNTLLLVGDKFR